jgi:hypothetical protein
VTQELVPAGDLASRKLSPLETTSPRSTPTSYLCPTQRGYLDYDSEQIEQSVAWPLTSRGHLDRNEVDKTLHPTSRPALGMHAPVQKYRLVY